MYIRRPRYWFPLAVILAFVTVSTASATTYYVAANGSDKNNGTSKSTPWLFAPGMSGCSANCAAVTPQPGDQIIVRGGDMWHFGDSGSPTYLSAEWHIAWSGTSGSRIYIGVDKTWYSGTSWTRPVLNGDGADFSNRGSWVWLNNVNYVTFDNFEFTGMNVANSCGWGECNYLTYDTNSTYVTVEHCYFHGWSHSGAGNDNMTAVEGDSHNPTQNVGCVFAYNVVDGSDSTNGGDSGAAMLHGPPIIYGNYITNVTNGLETNGTDVHDNVIGPVNKSFDGSQHENGIEQLGAGPLGSANYYYNNVVYGTNAVNVWIFGITGSSTDNPAYVFNNVIYDTDQGNVFNLCGHSPSVCSGAIHVFNNTIECGPDSSPSALCIGNSATDGTITELDADNNHLISSGSYYSCAGVSTCNVGTNQVEQTKTVASTAGYTISNRFQPTSDSAPTVGTGANLTNTYCMTMAAAARGFGDTTAAQSACQKGTTVGVGYDRTNHTVIVPAKSPNLRPSSGAWDVGAYQYGGGTATVNPPTGLTAVVH